jgi:hypothetical protein
MAAAKKPVYKWPDYLAPQLKTKEDRRNYLERPSVRRWLAMNAEGLRVLDIRFFHCTRPEIIELTEVYHQVQKKSGRKEIRVRVVCGDPPPYFRRLANGSLKQRTKSRNTRKGNRKS